MLVLPLRTPLLRSGDDLAAILRASSELGSGNIVVVSSKAVATVEGAHIDLASLTPSDTANEWSEKTGRSAAFCQAVLNEVTKRRGAVVGHCPGALLCELRPNGLEKGSILSANAGLDESNTQQGTAIGWPADPVASVRRLRSSLSAMASGSLGVIITDSCVHPRRWGVAAFALTASGLDPLRSEVGKTDLFGRTLRITNEAIADQLATIGNFLMGNAGQSTPAAIVQDHGLALTEWEGWIPAVEPSEDLFRGLLG